MYRYFFIRREPDNQTVLKVSQSVSHFEMQAGSGERKFAQQLLMNSFYRPPTQMDDFDVPADAIFAADPRELCKIMGGTQGETALMLHK